jgi:hypothetical protein
MAAAAEVTDVAEIMVDAEDAVVAEDTDTDTDTADVDVDMAAIDVAMIIGMAGAGTDTVAGGMVAGGLMAWVPAGVWYQVVGFGSATDGQAPAEANAAQWPQGAGQVIKRFL